MSADALYKIRHRKTGLFSTGGAYPGWSKKGKSWSSLTYVKSHLALVGGQRCVANLGHPYADAYVVGFEVTLASTMPIQALLDEVKQAKVTKRLATEERVSERRKDRERAELQRLRRLYPDE